MPRPVKNNVLKPYKDVPFDQLWHTLDSAMFKSGMYKHIATNDHCRKLLAKAEQKVSESVKGISKTDPIFLYRSRVSVARFLMKDNNNWVIRVISDPKRLSKVNIVKEEFLKYGPSALPEYYKGAENYGAVFKWDKAADTTIIMMMRGLGKTHNEVICRSIFDFIIDPSEKCLIGHSEDKKAEDNLKRLRDSLFHPNLAVMFPEFFVDDVELYRIRGTVIRKNRINMRVLDFKDMARIIDPSDYMRGESTWNLFTPRVDVTGQHYNRVKLDDFVTEANSGSESRAESITTVFNSLEDLEEYVFDKKTGETKGIPIQITDTQYYIPNMITEAIEKRLTKTFIMPMTWDPDEHKTIYSFCKEHKHRIDPMVTDDFIDKKKRNTTKNMFLAQRYMIGIEREAIIDLANDVRSFSFGYSDEWSPDGTAKMNFTYESLHENNPISISKDSSYSKKQKKHDDGKSNDVCVRCVHKDNVYFFTGEFSELGNLSLEGQKKSVILLSKDYYPDFLIADSQGTQIFVSNQIFTSLQEDEFLDQDYIEYIPYTKTKESETVGKAATIQSVLSAMFQSGAIRVHWKLSKMIKQILRENKGFDFLDAMVQIMAIPKGTIESAAYFKQLRNETKVKEKDINLQNKNKSRTIFKTTGY